MFETTTWVIRYEYTSCIWDIWKSFKDIFVKIDSLGENRNCCKSFEPTEPKFLLLPYISPNTSFLDFLVFRSNWSHKWRSQTSSLIRSLKKHKGQWGEPGTVNKNILTCLKLQQWVLKNETQFFPSNFLLGDETYFSRGDVFLCSCTFSTEKKT